MAKTLKIFLIVLGLGILILPSQMFYAETFTNHCEQVTDEKCCSDQEKTACHSEQSTDSKSKDKCTDDCAQCHTCALHFSINFLSPDSFPPGKHQFYVQQLPFNYGISYFSSSIPNIWQPPKIG